MSGYLIGLAMHLHLAAALATLGCMILEGALDEVMGR